MARIRITLEDDDGREINGDKERLYDLSGGATRLVDIEAAVENLKQAALSELTAESATSGKAGGLKTSEPLKAVV